MAEIFVDEFEERERYFPVQPPLIKKYQYKDKHKKDY
jgi:hypothetical protein